MPQKQNPTAKRGRGRPPHVATVALRRKVSVAAGGGMRHTEIALALGISTDTLLRYYADELTTGALARRMEALSGLHALAKKGNPGAVRAYLAIQPQLMTAPTEGDQPAVPAPAEPPKATPGVRLGKKDQAQADAMTAPIGTEWGSLLPVSLQ